MTEREAQFSHTPVDAIRKAAERSATQRFFPRNENDPRIIASYSDAETSARNVFSFSINRDPNEVLNTLVETEHFDLFRVSLLILRNHESIRGADDHHVRFALWKLAGREVLNIEESRMENELALGDKLSPWDIRVLDRRVFDRDMDILNGFRQSLFEKADVAPTPRVMRV